MFIFIIFDSISRMYFKKFLHRCTCVIPDSYHTMHLGFSFPAIPYVTILMQITSLTNQSTLLIFTGHGLGSIASLLVMSLLHNIALGKDLPICITFGSPLVS